MTVSRELARWATKQGFALKHGMLAKTLQGYPVALYDVGTLRRVVIGYCVGATDMPARLALAQQQNKLPRAAKLTRHALYLSISASGPQADQKALDFINKGVAFLQAEGVLGESHCAVCHEPLETPARVRVDATLLAAHPDCVDEYNATLPTPKHRGYGKGFCAALLGVLAGVALWAGASWIGFFPPLMGVAIGLLATLCWRWYGPMSRKAPLFILIALIVGLVPCYAIDLIMTARDGLLDAAGTTLVPVGTGMAFDTLAWIATVPAVVTREAVSIGIGLALGCIGMIPSFALHRADAAANPTMELLEN